MNNSMMELTDKCKIYIKYVGIVIPLFYPKSFMHQSICIIGQLFMH